MAINFPRYKLELLNLKQKTKDQFFTFRSARKIYNKTLAKLMMTIFHSPKKLCLPKTSVINFRSDLFFNPRIIVCAYASFLRTRLFFFLLQAQAENSYSRRVTWIHKSIWDIAEGFARTSILHPKSNKPGSYKVRTIWGKKAHVPN